MIAYRPTNTNQIAGLLYSRGFQKKFGSLIPGVFFFRHINTLTYLVCAVIRLPSLYSHDHLKLSGSAAYVSSTWILSKKIQLALQPCVILRSQWFRLTATPVIGWSRGQDRDVAHPKGQRRATVTPAPHTLPLVTVSSSVVAPVHSST